MTLRHVLSGAVAADVAIARALDPPVQGVACGVGCAVIPSNWLALCLAGTTVAGCTNARIDTDGGLYVNDVVQARIQDAAVVSALGLDAAQVAAFKGRIAGARQIFSDGTKRGLAGAGSGIPSAPNNIVWTQAQCQAVLDDAQPHWWYAYLLTANGVTMRPGGRFVPFWGNDMRVPGTLTPFDQAHIDAAVAEVGPDGYLIFGGEIDQGTPPPDLDTLVADWNTLAADPGVIANRLKLVSPTLALTVASGDKLELFYNAVTRKPDAISIHAYDGAPSGSVAASAAHILSRITAHKAKYPGIPIWVTEWGYNGGSPTSAQFAALMAVVQTAFEADPDIQMHSLWYSGPITILAAKNYPGAYALYDDNAVITGTGIANKQWR